MSFEFEYKGIRVRGDDKVYRPGEDTVLLLDWVLTYDHSSYDIDIDLGSGTGIIGIGNAHANGRYTLALDISLDALKYTVLNSRLNGVDGYIEPILSNEDIGFLREDLRLFIMSNPPYLPVTDESPWWSGGEGGFDIIINLLLKLIERHHFRLLFVYSSYADLSTFTDFINVYKNIHFVVLDSIHFPMEILYLGMVCKE